MKIFLFKFKSWMGDPYNYYLVYGDTEEEAKVSLIEKGKLRFNNGSIPLPENIISCTVLP